MVRIIKVDLIEEDQH